MRPRHLAMVAAMVALGCTAFAQNAPAPPRKKPAATAKTTKKEATLTPEKQRARELLETGAAQARDSEPPMRAYSLWQVANAYSVADRDKAAELLEDAFRATSEIEGDDEDSPRHYLQQNILLTLLPMRPAKVEEFLPQTSQRVRRFVTARMAEYYMRQKQYDKALATVDDLSRGEEFPYEAASRLMKELPADRDGDRLNLYMQALASFRQHEHKSMQFQRDDFASLIVRYWNKLPAAAVLEGVDEVLKQAKAAEKESKDEAKLSIASDSGSASFNSLFEYRLFQLLPALRKLDPDKAERLLRENRDLQYTADRLPNGMQSLDPEYGERTGGGGVRTSFSVGPKGGQGGGGGQMERMEERVPPSFTKDVTENPRQAIASALNLPARSDRGPSPRVGALIRVAEANEERDPASAKLALDEALKSIDSMPPMAQGRMLAQMADLYFRVGSPSGSQRAIAEGLKAAERLYAEDTNANDPNKALKAFWPSTQVWRSMIFAAVQVAPEMPEEIIKGIGDEEIQAVERIAYATALMAAPPTGSMMMRQGKQGTMVMQSEGGPRRQ